MEMALLLLLVVLVVVVGTHGGEHKTEEVGEEGLVFLSVLISCVISFDFLIQLSASQSKKKKKVAAADHAESLSQP